MYIRNELVTFDGNMGKLRAPSSILNWDDFQFLQRLALMALCIITFYRDCPCRSGRIHWSIHALNAHYTWNCNSRPLKADHSVVIKMIVIRLRWPELATTKSMRVLSMRNAGPNIVFLWYQQGRHVLFMALRMSQASTPCGIRYSIRIMSMF